jgi:hypothetical protein
MIFGNNFGGLETAPVFWQRLNMRMRSSQRPPYGSHQWLDMVNLEMCRAIATKIRLDPKLMRIPRKNLDRWRKKNRGLARAQQEWEIILKRYPTERVLEILTQENDEGQRLRQSDPFVGILTESERMAFFKLDEEVAA